MKTKIEIGQTVVSPKNGTGIITRIITKSTGYIEVDFGGEFKKEMAFNLSDENGVSLKSKPAKKELTEDQRAKNDRSHARFLNEMNSAILSENFLPCQIKSENYNRNLIN